MSDLRGLTQRRIEELCDRLVELDQAIKTEPRDPIIEASAWAIREELLRLARMLEDQDRSAL